MQPVNIQFAAIAGLVLLAFILTFILTSLIRKKRSSSKKKFRCLLSELPPSPPHERIIHHDFSNHYPQEIREMYEEWPELASKFCKYSLYTRLRLRGKILNQRSEFNRPAMENVLIKTPKFTHHFKEYFDDIVRIFELNDVYYNIDLGNIVDGPYKYEFGSIDIITEKRIIKLVCEEQFHMGSDIYTRYYGILRLASMHTNKNIKYTHDQNTQLIVINMLTNEWVEYNPPTK